MNLRDKKDLLWIFIATALILAWGSIPTWAGYRAETSNLKFRDIYFDSQDYSVHIAMMEAGRHGETAYQLKFTTEPHKPAYIRMFYIILGHVSRWLGLASETTFELARWTLGFAALFALYSLMHRIFTETFWVRVAFLIAALGSGTGWLQVIFNWTSAQITPIDFWLIDSYVFFSLSIFPHFAFVTLCECIALKLWLDFLDNTQWQKIGGITAIVVIAQVVNPIAFAPVDAALVGATFFSWWKKNKIIFTDIGAVIIVGVVQIPLLVYNYFVLSQDPIWSQFTEQNQTLSPPPDYYLWGFTLLWLFAILGLKTVFAGKSKAFGAAIFWILTAFLLAYAPVEIQRRFLQNITIPLAILAATGIKACAETISNLSPKWRRWETSLVIFTVFMISLSSIQLSLGRTAYTKTYPKELYYPASLDNAIFWLREHAQYNDFVLASEETSQVLAQKTGMRVYLGHEMETLNYTKKREYVKAFFQGTMDALSEKPIQWVIYGPLEKSINPNFHPAKNLMLVYCSKDLQIYRVR